MMGILERRVIKWAQNKGIDKAETWKPQFNKMAEEFGEYRDELEKENGPEYDRGAEMAEFGDIIVTLIIMAEQRGYSVYECLRIAYNKIKNRTGKTINGTFVKSADLVD